MAEAKKEPMNRTFKFKGTEEIAEGEKGKLVKTGKTIGKNFGRHEFIKPGATIKVTDTEAEILLENPEFEEVKESAKPVKAA